jgi:uncharacterized protein HemX
MTTRKAVEAMVLMALAIGTGVGLSHKPWMVYFEQKHMADKQRVEMRDSEDQRAELLRQESRVRSSVGQEELARSHGFISQGEVPADPQ